MKNTTFCEMTSYSLIEVDVSDCRTASVFKVEEARTNVSLNLDTNDGGRKFVLVGTLTPDYTASCRRKLVFIVARSFEI
jgi:hypothetical protein